MIKIPINVKLKGKCLVMKGDKVKVGSNTYVTIEEYRKMEGEKNAEKT